MPENIREKLVPPPAHFRGGHFYAVMALFLITIDDDVNSLEVYTAVTSLANMDGSDLKFAQQIFREAGDWLDSMPSHRHIDMAATCSALLKRSYFLGPQAKVGGLPAMQMPFNPKDLAASRAAQSLA
ncbi:MAG: hypothetical protein HOC43_04725 [Planctomycetes bacterium]|nr:hypothetical protein [Planctomycetota bacterium]